MYLQNYQIRNVLNVYRRQLICKNVKNDHPDGNHKAGSDSATTLEKGKMQRVIEKVSGRVLRKISTIDPLSDSNQEMIKQTQRTIENQPPVQRDDRFAFNIIVGNNQKETRSVARFSGKKLMSRFDEQVKGTAINHIAENFTSH